ncbi:ZIP family metal transporter [Oceanobacillus bengalensis]|uniref:ZIP family metal transporter n=1 Tax=Oceanobacillus bengalensis TaxID=1435466 RepID=UPI001FEBF809|nr:ZIP family metal transporter [Oceanobacillus bengalensis]
MGTAWIISAFASALGISIGGGLAWIMKGFQRGFGFIYSLCAGLIVGLLFLEMIPESIELGGWIILAIGIAIGLLLFQYIHQLMDKITIITDSHQKDIFVRSGVLLAFSIAFHNFPVGIVLGPTMGTDIGGLMLTTLVLHNIPEGIIVFTPLFLAGFGIFTCVFITAIITLPIALGTLLGQSFNLGIPSLLAFMINLSIAIIFMVAVKEIFGEAVRNSTLLFSLVIGLFGFGIIYLYMNFSL